MMNYYIKTFRWKKSYERKGEEARIHTGVIAQEVEQAFRDEGLDPFRYGMLARGDHYEVDGDRKILSSVSKQLGNLRRLTRGFNFDPGFR